MKDINSNKYWDNRFKTDWIKNAGDMQTAFFGKLIVDNLPDSIIREMSKGKQTLCDVGCAEGECAKLFSDRFTNLEITGIDFSPTAIKLAKKKFNNIIFKSEDLLKISEKYDFTVCSNTLEHFEEPEKILSKLTSITNNSIIILIPFQEVNRIPEHFTSFDYDNIPLYIDGFKLSFLKVINCSLTPIIYWDGLEVLLVYTKTSEDDKSVELIINKKISKLNEDLTTLNNSLKDYEYELLTIKNAKYYKAFHKAKRIIDKSSILKSLLSKSKKLLSKKDKKIVAPQKNSEYRNTLWFKALKNSQGIVSKNTPNKYYLDAYRAAEFTYWRHLPEWLYELKGKKINNVLDVGCAYGTLSIFAKKVLNSNIYCTDFTDRYLSKQLIKKYNFNFAINNIEKDPFPWNIKFDLVILTEVIEHFNFNPVPTLKKIASQLRKGGYLFLSTPDAKEWGKAKYYQNIKDIPELNFEDALIDDHVYQYELDELESVLKASGFSIKKVDYSSGMNLRHINIIAEKV